MTTTPIPTFAEFLNCCGPWNSFWSIAAAAELNRVPAAVADSWLTQMAIGGLGDPTGLTPRLTELSAWAFDRDGVDVGHDLDYLRRMFEATHPTF